MKKEILLIGGGGHCHSCIDVIEQEGKYQIAGIIDKKELVGQKVLDYKIIGSDDDLQELFKTYQYAIITLGQIHTSQIRKKIYNTLKDIGYTLPVIISPKAYVSKHAQIQEGTIIMHDVIVNAASNIAKNCIINSKALIEHDAVIGQHCHISTAAIVNGHVKIGSDCFIGSNATVCHSAIIEDGSFIKAGSLYK